MHISNTEKWLAWTYLNHLDMNINFLPTCAAACSDIKAILVFGPKVYHKLDANLELGK